MQIDSGLGAPYSIVSLTGGYRLKDSPLHDIGEFYVGGYMGG